MWILFQTQLKIWKWSIWRKLSRLPELGEKVKTPDGEGEVDGVETLKEIVRVKIKDDDGYFYKKYKANEIVRNDKVTGGEKKWHIKLQINVLDVEHVLQVAQYLVFHKEIANM